MTVHHGKRTHKQRTLFFFCVSLVRKENFPEKVFFLCFSGVENCKLDSRCQMSSNRCRHCVWDAKIWSWNRSERLKVPTMRRYEKARSTKNSNICCKKKKCPN